MILYNAFDLGSFVKRVKICLIAGGNYLELAFLEYHSAGRVLRLIGSVHKKIISEQLFFFFRRSLVAPFIC